MSIENLNAEHFRISTVRRWGQMVLERAAELEDPPEPEIIESLSNALANPSLLIGPGEKAFEVIFASVYRRVIDAGNANHLPIELRGLEKSLRIFQGSALEVLGSKSGPPGEPAPTYSHLTKSELFSFFPDIQAAARRNLVRAERLLEQSTNEFVRQHLKRLTVASKIVLQMGLHARTMARRELLRIELHLQEIDRARSEDLGEWAVETKETIDRVVNEPWFEGNVHTLKQLSAFINQKIVTNELDEELKWLIIQANILHAEGLPRPSLENLKEELHTAQGLAPDNETPRVSELARRYEKRFLDDRSSMHPNASSLIGLADTRWSMADIYSGDPNDISDLEEKEKEKIQLFERLFNTAVELSWMYITSGNAPHAFSTIYGMEDNPLFASAILVAAIYRHTLGPHNPLYRRVVRPTILRTVTTHPFVAVATEIQSAKTLPVASALPAISKLGTMTMHLELAGEFTPHLLKLAQQMTIKLLTPTDDTTAGKDPLEEREWSISRQASISGGLFALAGYPGELAFFAADEPFAESAIIISPLPHTFLLILLSAILAVRPARHGRPGGLIRIFYKSDDDPSISIAEKLAQALGCSSKMMRGSQQIIRVSDIRGGGDDRPKGKGPGSGSPSPRGKGGKRIPLRVGGFGNQEELWPITEGECQAEVISMHGAESDSNYWMETDTAQDLDTDTMMEMGAFMTTMRASAFR